MTAEQLVRDQLDRATRDVPSSPDLETAIRQGRRRRLQRRGGAAIAAVAVLGIGTVGLRIATADDAQPVAARRAGRRSARPGSRAQRTRGLRCRAPTSTRPWWRSSPRTCRPCRHPMTSTPATATPPARCPTPTSLQAEDWQAAYTLAGGHEFLLMTALASEGPFSCQGCEHHAVPGGEIYREVSQSLESGKWQFAIWYVRGDGSTVGAFEYAPGQVDEPVRGDRVLSDTDLEALVRTRGLTFAALSAAGSSGR